MAVIEIEDKLAKALRAQAAVRDMTLETFLKRIAEMATPIHPATEFLPEEFDRSIAELSSESPVLPGDFSRADLYADHD